jgi:hypothetical protein
VKEFDLYKLVAAVLTLGHARTALIIQTLGLGGSITPKSLIVRGLDNLFSREQVDRAKDVEGRLRAARESSDAMIRDALGVPLIELIKILEEFDLPVTLAFSRRFKSAFEASSKLPDEKEIGELIFRLIDELRDRKFIGLRKDLGALFNTQQFPADVRLKYPSAVVDIDEAMNCLALERSTASVFHLMRVMEVAVRAAASCLGVPDPVRGSDKNWGRMLNQIKSAMDTKWPTSADKMLPDAKLFESLYVSLDAVKNGWRNVTMHVERTYTMDEAQRVRHAVESLLITMAGRFDENGDPNV